MRNAKKSWLDVFKTDKSDNDVVDPFVLRTLRRRARKQNVSAILLGLLLSIVLLLVPVGAQDSFGFSI